MSSSIPAPLRQADDPRSTKASLRWTLALALTGALATGVLHAGWLAWRLLVREELIWRPRDFAWMSPASYVLPFLATALVAWAAFEGMRALRPRFDARRGIAAATLFLVALSLVLLIPRLHPAARVLLALGAAARGAAPLARLSERALWRTGALLLLGVVLSGGAERLSRSHSERRAVGAPPAAPEGAPNVLLLILDTVRAKSLSLHGNPRPTTPALERWAREGTTFQYAFSTAPWTLPSHASIFTGRHPRELTAGERTPLDDHVPTLAEAFAERGYLTGGFVANIYYAGHDSGLDRGFARYDDYRTTWPQVLWSSTLVQTELFKGMLWKQGVRAKLGELRRFDLTLDPLRYGHRKGAPLVTDAFLDWERERRGRPYFAFLNYFDAHAAYIPPPRHARLFSDDHAPIDNYEACIRGLDDDIDRLLGELRNRGTLDNTIVVVTSDHGEYFGEHGKTGHGNGLHLPVLHVPLVMRYPKGIPAGLRVDAPVSLRELPGTLLALAGGPRDRFPAPLLSRWWEEGGEVDATNAEHVEAGNLDESDAHLPRAQRRVSVSLVSDSLHWIRDFGGEESLYAFRTDTEERTNLVSEAPFRAALDAMRAAAAAGRASHGGDPVNP